MKFLVLQCLYPDIQGFEGYKSLNIMKTHVVPLNNVGEVRMTMKATIEIELDDSVKLSIDAEESGDGNFGALHNCIKELNATIREYRLKLEKSGTEPPEVLKELQENIMGLQKVYPQN